MASLVVVVSSVFLAYLLNLFVYRAFFSHIAKIPGPPLARFSILWQLYHVWKGDYQDVIREAHEKYGQFVRVSHVEVSVCNDEAVAKILNKPLDKGSSYSIYAMPDSSFINQMSELSAHNFSILQKKIARGYALSSIIKSEDRFDYAIELFKNGIERVAARDGSVSFDDWFTWYSFDIVGLFTFSKEFGFLREEKDVGGCVATSSQLTMYLALMTYFPKIHDMLTALLNPVMAWLDLQPMAHVMSTTEKALADREANDAAERDMVAYWKAHSDNPITDRELFSTANANVAAGGDTVGTMTQAFLYHLLRNPSTVARLQEELDSAARKGLISSPVQYNQTLNLPYFQACMKEAYRIHPVSPTGFTRIAPTEGLKIKDTYFPAGTVVSVNAWAMHHDKALFGEDASVFRPERWLEANSISLERNYIPFGAGYMTCPGRHLGHVETAKLFTTMFLDYDMSLATPEKEWSLRSTIIVKGYDWKVNVNRRQKLTA